MDCNRMGKYKMNATAKEMTDATAIAVTRYQLATENVTATASAKCKRKMQGQISNVNLTADGIANSVTNKITKMMAA
jgi:hypothetical protein